MVELIKYVIGTFAEHPDQVKYDVAENGGSVTVTVTLQSDEMGKVIGKQGKLAKALRTLIRVGATDGKKYNLEIKECGEI